MNEQELKQHIQKTFDTVSPGYDNGALRFFEYAAQGLPAVFEFAGDERVLDVASGTGTPAAAIAPHVPSGSVTGIDFSQGMLAQAKAKAAERNLHNIRFERMDMTAMSLPEAHFDAANCSFGVFFVEDMVGLVRHIGSKLKPGGTLVTTHFYDGSFSPISETFLSRVETYGIEVPPIGWKRVGDEALNVELFRSAGLTNIETQRKNVGYHLKDAGEWWDIVWHAGYRGLVAGLEPERLEQFKREHLEEIDALATDDGIWLNIEVIYTKGTK